MKDIKKIGFFTCCRTRAMKYMIFGGLFGLCFPIVATILDLYAQGFSLSLVNIDVVHSSNVLHWIIDTAPLFLGTFAFFIGRRQDTIISMNRELESRISERTLELKNTNDKLTEQIAVYKRAKKNFGESTKQLETKIELILSLEKEKEISLLDLFYSQKLQLLQDSFANAFKISSVICDKNGSPLTEPSGYNCLCGIFQKNEIQGNYCRNLYREIGRVAAESNKPAEIMCKNSDCFHAGAPIIIEGQHIATWVIGHYSVGDRRITVPMELGRQFGIDEKSLRSEFDSIPVLSKSHLKAILKLLMIFSEELSSLGYGNLQLARDIVRRKKIESDYADANRQLIAKNEEIARHENQVRKQHSAIIRIATDNNVIWGNQEEALRIITETTADTMCVSRVSVWTLSDDKQKIRLIDLFEQDSVRHSHGTEFFAKDFPIYFEALAGEQAIDVIDAQNDPRTQEFAEEYLKPRNIVSILNSPIRLSGKVKGVICCEQTDSIRKWTADDISFIGEIASQTALLFETIERRKVQEQLAIFKRFTEDSILGCAIVDLHGGLVYANPTIRSIFGYNAHDDIYGKNAIEFFPKNIKSKLKSKILHSVLKTGQWLDDVDIIREDGTEVPTVQNVFFVRDEDGNPQYFANIVVDMTDKVEAERQQTELKEKLEKAERMESLGILAGGVAHDLNNMLGPLVGYPEIILMRLEEDNPIRKKVERMGKAARDAADVISDLLTLARRGRYEMAPLNFAEVVADYLDSPSFLKLTEENQHIHFSYKTDESLGAIKGSGPHLAKIVMNLIVNAFDAMPDGGDLTVEIRQDHLDQLYGGFANILEGDFIVLKVRDTGQGIEQENLTKIFEPYYSNKKMGRSGSGLGLSVVYGIVKDHGGYYDIFSKVGHGTEFVIYFPVLKQAINIPVKIETRIGGEETILVVDDTEEQREVAKELLQNLGYKVSSVVNGRAAVKEIKTNQYDLILLDMIMEDDFDGLDTYREIIKILPGQKALIVSGYSSTERVQEMQRLGAGQYIKKPYSLKTIGQAVREELDRQPVVASK